MRVEKMYAPDESLMPLDKYLDKEGPFSIDYRKCDSTWALADEEELNAGLEWWRKQIDEGKADEYLET